MITRVTLRPAMLRDLRVIHAIRQDAILGISTTTLTDTARQAWASSRSPAYFMERVVSGQVIIAVHGGHAVGWGSISGATITGLYVRPAFGLNGVGRQIMANLEACILGEGHAYARLESSPNAVQFYRRLGYALVGPPGKDGAIPMHKILKNSEMQPR